MNFLYALVEGAWIPLFVVWWGHGIKVIVVLLVYVICFPSACGARRWVRPRADRPAAAREIDQMTAESGDGPPASGPSAGTLE